MKEKKVFIYILAVSAFIIALWLVLFYIPERVELQTLEEESEQYERKIAFALEAIRNNVDLEKSISDLNSEVNKMQKKLIHDPSLGHIVEILRQEFKKYNVKIHHISPVMNSYLGVDKGGEKGSFYRLPLEMKLEAKFMDFVHLLENSENLIFFLNPDQISIYKNEDAATTLLIDFKASVYMSRGTDL